jgi:hypothetical protein
MNALNSPQADLGRAATALLATPGVAIPANFLQQGPWFLIDSYGGGPLMGCKPATSQSPADVYPRINTYDNFGMLRQQLTSVLDMATGKVTPVPLVFLFQEPDPYLVSHAEQPCYAGSTGSTSKYYYAFRYANGHLNQIVVAQDADCVDYAGTYTYAYRSAAVPNLPTNVEFVDSRGRKQSWQFTYHVAGGVLQSVDAGGGVTINYEYGGGSGTLLRQMTVNAPPQPSEAWVMNYTSGLQWLGYALQGAPLPWGLTITYDANNRPITALQNTGCGPDECQPATFTYANSGKGHSRVRLPLALRGSR